jgi:hypothetical protein
MPDKCEAKAKEIMEEFMKRSNSPDYIDMLSMPGGQHSAFFLMEEVAKEVCGEDFTFRLVQQIHDEYVIEVAIKKPTVDLIDEGFSALAILQEQHEGDEPEMLALLKNLQDALQHALELRQTIIDIDKWVGENEGIGCCEYVDYDKDINTTKSYQIAKELTKVNKV